MRPVIFKGICKSAAAIITPITAAPPDISVFISSILSAGLMEIPPLSKVNPFPTKTMGASFFLLPAYSRMINFGSSLLPEATARRAFIPISFILSLSRALQDTFFLLAISPAFCARIEGVISLEGAEIRSRAKQTASAIIRAFFTVDSIKAKSFASAIIFNSSISFKSSRPTVLYGVY